jgi:N-acetylglucosaminyldiphosphoundecaprenol N-acetyl-beta-D-mannosaminyltransferase
MEILGVKVDALGCQQTVAKIGDFLSVASGHFITTPNPEIVLYAHRHSEYRDILNKADLALPDGIGLLWASRAVGEPLKERVSGTDMVPEICRLARERGLRIALLGGLNQSSIDKAAAIMRQWGNAVVYAQHGVPKEEWDNRASHDKIVHELRATSPELLLVGFGHPKQEQWIDEYRSRLPSVRLFMGCGGALDFIADAAKRAPSWMRKAGLEWLWRLFIEPKRYRRIFDAVIVFPLTVIYARFWKK